MPRFTVAETPIGGLKLVKRSRIGDQRGFLSRLYCSGELYEAGWTRNVVQVNHTLTSKTGAVRGMHFQYPPHAEMKLVSCLRGRVWDVAVDLRAGSPTFLNWHAEELSPENGRAMLIPEGFAHGFQTLVDDCELLYFHTSAYCADAEGAINAMDPLVGIRWPMKISERSMRDAEHELLTKNFCGIRV